MKREYFGRRKRNSEKIKKKKEVKTQFREGSINPVSDDTVEAQKLCHPFKP